MLFSAHPNIHYRTANKKLQTGACERKTDHNAPVVYQNTEFSV